MFVSNFFLYICGLNYSFLQSVYSLEFGQAWMPDFFFI
jgi:hypothetical protein